MARAATPPTVLRRQPPRRRRTIKIALLVVSLYTAAAIATGSLVVPVVLVVCLALFGACAVATGRLLGVGRHHRTIAWLMERSWRDPPQVLQLALRALPETLTWAPSGRWYGHRRLVLWLNPLTFDALVDRVRGQALAQWATDAYEGVLADHASVLDETGAPHVAVRPSDDIGRGQWRFTHAEADPPARHRPGAPAAEAADPDHHSREWDSQPSRFASPPFLTGWQDGGTVDTASFHDGLTVRADVEARHKNSGTSPGEPPTVLESDAARDSSAPPIGLVTTGHLQQTALSPAVAGRGGDADLRLPDVPTISRRHAVLTHRSGRWWIESCGRNGLTINGIPVVGARALHHNDVLTWGSTPSSPTSRVEIGG